MARTYNLFVGRWQPFHKGHRQLIQTVLDEGEHALIAIRDTKISKDNPHTVKERKKMILKAFPSHRDKIKIVVIPDIHAICYGRSVGYDIRRIRLDSSTESVSGTNIRNGNI